jgi:hypothetical protein
MSLIITLNVREGIVMASDSRITLDRTLGAPPNQTVVLSVAQSDTNYKTFLTPTSIGISTCGAASINGVPISGYIESFINDVAVPKNLEVDALPDELLTYFAAMSPVPATQFHVSGYKRVNNTSEQHVWRVYVDLGKTERLSVGDQGIVWGGEIDVLTRLLQPLAMLDANGAIASVLPHHAIPWGFFTLQDAIDFSTFALRSTIDAMRFQPRPKTVGGPIDVLVIKPTGAFWVQKKELKVGP